MKAVIYEEYGPPEVLQIVEVDKPAPKDDEVLIKVHATTVHRGDSRMRGLDIPGARWKRFLARLVLGFNRPKNAILGMELAGVVEAVGQDVTRFKPGDQVFASTVWSGFGAHAEYKCMPQDGVLALKPANMTFEEAAVLPAGGITTLGIIKMAQLRPGKRVLIYGASGSIGTFAVQMAKSMGAEVTGVCSTGNLDLVRSLGGEHVIDYTKEEFAQHQGTYDVVFDAVDKMPGDYKRLLKANGIYLNIDSSSDKIKKADTPDLLRELRGLAEAGQVKAVIDRSYPLEQIVDAHRYVDTGRKKGNVVITVAR